MFQKAHLDLEPCKILTPFTFMPSWSLSTPSSSDIKMHWWPFKITVWVSWYHFYSHLQSLTRDGILQFGTFTFMQDKCVFLFTCCFCCFFAEWLNVNFLCWLIICWAGRWACQLLTPFKKSAASDRTIGILHGGVPLRCHLGNLEIIWGKQRAYFYTNNEFAIWLHLLSPV